MVNVFKWIGAALLVVIFVTAIIQAHNLSNASDKRAIEIFEQEHKISAPYSRIG